MKKNIKKIMGAALAFCLTAVMLFGGLVEVQAAKKAPDYTKSFTKSAKMSGALLEMKMDAKKDTTITVSASTTSKDKNVTMQVKMWKLDDKGEISGEMAMIILDNKTKSGKFKVNVKKGVNTLWVENVGAPGAKVKIKVTAKSGKVIKCTSVQLMDEAG